MSPHDAGRAGTVEKVSVRVRFERFPATIKGAFILRGEDPDPHQVVFGEARVVALAGGVPHPVPVFATALDIAPHRDVFVPFEFVVTELDPGWYGFECDLEVDGVAGTFPGERRFAVAWPRASVRRGQIRVDRTVRLGQWTSVRVESVDCGADSVKVSATVDPPRALTARLLADGERLPSLDAEVDEASGRARFTAYPLLRLHRSLRIELKGHGRGAEGALDIRLP